MFLCQITVVAKKSVIFGPSSFSQIVIHWMSKTPYRLRMSAAIMIRVFNCQKIGFIFTTTNATPTICREHFFPNTLVVYTILFVNPFSVLFAATF